MRLAFDVFGDGQHAGGVVHAGKREWRSVGHDTGGTGNGHFADRQRGGIEHQRMKSPEMPLSTQRQLALGKFLLALCLLKMLRPKEHALGPHHTTAITHASTRFILKSLGHFDIFFSTAFL